MSSPTIQREARLAWLTMRYVLESRGLCQKTKDGIRHIQYKGWEYLDDIRAFMFIVDTARMPGVALEALDKPDVAKHLRAALEGRPVIFTNHRGFAITVGRDVPARTERRRLPVRVDLDLGGIPSGALMLPIGETASGPVWRSLHDLDTVLVAGTRRQGKSMWLNAALAALLTANTPDALQVALIDLKEVELRHWQAAPHLFGGIVATDAEDAMPLLGRLHGEYERRRALFSAAGIVRNLAAYNDRAAEPLPAILLIADEVPDLALGDAGEAIRLLTRIVQKGGAFGIYVILSAQRPDSSVIPGILKAQLATRITFWQPSANDYRVALQQPAGWRVPDGMERRPGRLIACLPGGEVVAQGYCLNDEVLEAVVARVCGGTTGVPLLAPVEAEMVAWAIRENDGYLGLADIQRELGLTAWKARRLAQKWEQRAWLVKDPDAKNKRRLTEELEELVA